MQNRIGSCKRKTKETDIELTINRMDRERIRLIQEFRFLIICWMDLQDMDYLI